MIPKIIHLCWLSGDKYPVDIQECLDSWKKYLPDYEIWLWDTNRFDINSALWTKQAYQAKKYAFAADYIRLYALYHYGGIYMDSDVLVYKSFNDLLDLPYFIGQDYLGSFEPAIIGSEKGNAWIKDVLDAYVERPFVKSDGTMDIHNLPVMFFERLFPKYKFKSIHAKSEFAYNPQVISLFDKDFFNSRDNLTFIRTKKSYCAHKFTASWGKPQSGFRNCLYKLLPTWLLNWFLELAHAIKKDKVHRYDPIYMQSHKRIV